MDSLRTFRPGGSFPAARRLFCTAAGLMAAGLTAAMAVAPARAADFPRQPIRLVVPFSAGSGTDLAARELAQRLGETNGWQIVVDNKPGANGFIAVQDVMRAPADGYTLIMTGNTTHAANPALFQKLPYDPIADFAPITRGAIVPLVLFAAPKHGFQSVAQLVERARAQPGTLSFATGSASHRLSGEILKQRAGVQATHVGYKGSPQALTDLIGGHVDFMFVDMPAGISFIKAGTLVPLAVTSPKRLAILPNVPTMAESGFPGFEVSGWSAFFAPAKTPPDIIAKLHAAISGYLLSPSGKAFAQNLGGYVEPTTPQQTTEWVRSEIDSYKTTFRQAGIAPE